VSCDGLNTLGQNIQYRWQEQYKSEILDLRSQVALQDILLRDARVQEHARMEQQEGVPGVASSGGGHGNCQGATICSEPAVDRRWGPTDACLRDGIRACWSDDP